MNKAMVEFGIIISLYLAVISAGARNIVRMFNFMNNYFEETVNKICEDSGIDYRLNIEDVDLSLYEEK